ncbi:hypothetical protein [Parafrankia sp. FMc2]|uniref:hypothetical protein n=1 Tax=Parafrankia sp. FMc2 TaxID=3233196 RepID=UPI003B58AE90
MTVTAGLAEVAPELVRRAVDAGVRRFTVVWCGGVGPAEQAVADSGVEWIRLEQQEFMSNTLTWIEALTTGERLATREFAARRQTPEREPVGAAHCRRGSTLTTANTFGWMTIIRDHLVAPRTAAAASRIQQQVIAEKPSPIRTSPGCWWGGLRFDQQFSEVRASQDAYECIGRAFQPIHDLFAVCDRP